MKPWKRGHNWVVAIVFGALCFLGAYSLFYQKRIERDVPEVSENGVKKYTYVFVKQGCKFKNLTKDESELWGTFAQDKKWVFLAPHICEGTYSLMSSEGPGAIGTVSFVDGGIIVELDNLRIGIK